MSVKTTFIVGAVAVAASDIGAGFLPDSLDFNGMPVRVWGAAIGGAYLGEKFGGGSATLGKAFISGVIALAGANMARRYLPNLRFPLGPVDGARLAAGGAALYGAQRLGVEKAP